MVINSDNICRLVKTNYPSLERAGRGLKNSLTKLHFNIINKLYWIVFILLIALIIFVRLRLLEVPLERDEGEYAYMGQMILKGEAPYQSVYNMKFPGTYYMYALIMSVFGQTVRGIHSGLILINITSIILLFFLTKKIAGNYAALISSSAFGVLSLSFSVGGFAGHSTHFVIVMALAGFLLLILALESHKGYYFLFSGFFLALAMVMKQPGIFFIFLGGILVFIYLLINKKGNTGIKIRHLILFICGGLIVILVLVSSLLYFGVFKKFWFWTIQYASDYASQVGVRNAFMMFKTTFSLLIKGYFLIWLIASIGILLLVFNRNIKSIYKIFIFLMLLFSFFAICPGFYFREHYFIMMLPAIAILFSLACIFLIETNKRFLKYLAFITFISPLIIGFLSQKEYFFSVKPEQVSRDVYGLNPFPESLVIAGYIKSNTSESDKIAVLGSEPQIFFYANRQSATGYIYTYSLMEEHKNSLKMQKEMIEEIERSQPSHLVYCYISTSWLAKEKSETYIFDWINPYLQKNNFQLKGIIDIDSDKTVYKWDNDALKYKPLSDFYIQVFQRN